MPNTNAADRKPVLSIIGLGKLGSPMAAVLGAKGYEVIGVDLHTDFVSSINAGKAPVQEPRLQEMIDKCGKRLRATSDYDDAIHNSDITFIIVPTPSRSNGLFTNRFVVGVMDSIGKSLRTKKSYHIVVVCSTVLPGSMGGEIRTALEQTSGRTVGADLGLCYNPEFIALGSVVTDLLNPDMILIGESDAKAGEALEAIYRNSTDSNPEIHRMNWVNAELTKISVNTFVTTKISYANMIADMCDHLPNASADVVTRAVGADSRIGRKYLKPAIGYGGPCFPRDNKAFSALGRKLGVNCTLAEATDHINDHQLQRLRGAVEARASEGSIVAILGMSYKPHTHVIEESQGVALAKMLAEDGYVVVVVDPLAARYAEAALGSLIDVANTAEEAAARADVIVVTTPYAEFGNIPASALQRSGKQVAIIDPWGVFKPETIGKAELIRLGNGGWKSVAGEETPRIGLVSKRS